MTCLDTSQCITGQLKLHGGHLDVLGKPPLTKGHEVPGRAVGYMPQEIALYMEFTVLETLKFFAKYV
jgi:ABC-type multidrug transport system ATPase subunit